MKKLLIGAMAAIIATGIVSCGNSADKTDTGKDSSAAKTEAVSQASSEKDGEPSEEAESSEAAKDESSDMEIDEDSSDNKTGDESSAETEKNNDGDGGNGLFTDTEDIDPALLEKLDGLLSAAAQGDEERFLQIFDIDAYMDIYLDDSAKDLGSNRDMFEDTAKIAFDMAQEKLGGSYSGELTNFIMEECSHGKADLVTAEEVYDIAFTIEGDLNSSATVFYSGGVWSIELYDLSFVDMEGYHEFEDIIIGQLNAAATGDRDKYMEYADLDLFTEVLVIAYSDEDSEYYIEITDEDIEEAKVFLQTFLDMAFEELSEALDGEVDKQDIWVQEFEFVDTELEGIDAKGARFGDRILLLVRDPQGGYQELEGSIYEFNGRKGVTMTIDG